MDATVLTDLFSEDPYVALSTHATTFLPNSPSSSLILQSTETEAGILQLTDEQRDALIKIEDIFEIITEGLIDGKKELTVSLKSRSRRRDQASGRSVSNSIEARAVSFPGKTVKEAHKFTVILRILGLSHEALITGTITTKRDIYYKDPELFMNQNLVDRYVDDLAYTLGVSRSALNIVAAAKGLVIGDFCILRSDDEIVDYSTEIEGALVPNVEDIQAVDVSKAKWILVIEKEATFRHLAKSSFWRESTAGKGILITAKGFPDMQTRSFLRHLAQQKETPPIYALVDFDPDGIAILSTYKHGSVNLAHENENLIVSRIQWLGIRSTDILGYDTEGESYGLLKLTKRDRRIARRMLEKEIYRQGGEEDWRSELQVMLLLNVKAEMQIMGSNAALSQWLSKRLCAAERKLLSGQCNHPN